MVVDKSARTITLYSDSVPIKEYRIALGSNPVGHKRQNGDGRTPEGAYILDYRNPDSRYHLSMHVSYPNSQDKDSAMARGIDPGGDIMLHGLQNGLGWIGRFHRLVDWTNGCIAVTNAEMDQIWQAVSNGTRIEINP